MKKKSKIVLGLAVIVGVVCLLVIFVANIHTGDPRTMEEYKKDAISEIKQLSENEEWIQEQMKTLKENQDDPQGLWFSNRFLPFKNGEWMICMHRGSKGDSRTNRMLRGEDYYDIFIGYGSDGKWYYSTYHFCVEMLVLRMFGQPESLKQFAQKEEDYYVHEFNGHPSSCTEKTWPLDN